jgi:2,3-bisphosphoglycerate-independent phosphoglycerate mutase
LKTLFLIADGMGGWPLERLDGRTCMEAAQTPQMDELAAKGVVGRIHTIPEGMAPGSDVANMALLGFDPAAHHTGRGPIEAAAQGLTLDPDDLVWRLNLVNLTELDLDGRMLDYSAGHIPTEISAPIVQRLQERLGNDTFTFVPGVQYRHLLVQKGGANTEDATLLINPPHDITDKPIRRDLAKYSKSAELWDLIHEGAQVLAEDWNETKARAIWPWGQGRPLSLPGFEAEYGMRGAVISAVDLIKGLGRAAGMAVVDVPGATGLLDTDYEGKVAAALEFLKDGDFVFVHLEGPDECGHGGDVAGKVEAISRFDARVVAPLREALRGEECAWLCACDHFTPIAEKTHTTDPVPFLYHAPGCAPSGAAAFSERECAASGLDVAPGHGIVRWVLGQLAGK